jgi:hypothetical protein
LNVTVDVEGKKEPLPVVQLPATDIVPAPAIIFPPERLTLPLTTKFWPFSVRPPVPEPENDKLRHVEPTDNEG